MNDQSPLRAGGSLLERAADLYGFGLGTPPSAPHEVTQPAAPAAVAPAAPAAPLRTPAPEPRPAPAAATVSARVAGRGGKIDPEALARGGFIAPDAPGSALAEEFRIVKRQLLRNLAGSDDKARNILVCSALPNEGKTFCAINLALSLAAEKDVEVLLIDADFPKPEVLALLGLEAGPGLTDALADPDADPESFVVRTDLRGLSLLPAGRPVGDVTELLASERTRRLLARLADPRRIILFDSPPALMASPATVLASHVGQLLMVVRADQTSEADLREAVGLLSACDQIRLLLNGTGFAVNGRRFGSYYGYGQ
ncbi:exopolysaccharide biosynthesis protein [Sphingosinicella sp. BN140058]|uniref:exopolysaccharide biosynthesis protein n=1 Tax=Sphingosinicella sp. BN140058 TaxID=1892855 RepID=UPI0010129B26|nr:exopolysaccharide biosynthesis protein [Sphingosinicella sp. BN140058]QAY79158.1 exopolysaccharide biosynthesis protein [Sphingosinicella sp. BN140058]